MNAQLSVLIEQPGTDSLAFRGNAEQQAGD
jgi:hypothetical protein